MDTHTPKFENKQSSTLAERIDKLQEVIRLKNSPEQDIWLQARLAEIAAEIKEEVSNTAPDIELSGIPEWEKLVTGNATVDFDVTARKYVQKLLDAKLAEVEHQLEIE
jgi:predicted transcriptional regulator